MINYIQLLPRLGGDGVKRALQKQQYPGICSPERLRKWQVRPGPGQKCKPSGPALAAAVPVFLLPVQESSFFVAIIVVGLLLLGLVMALLLWQFVRRQNRAPGRGSSRAAPIVPPAPEAATSTQVVEPGTELHHLETVPAASMPPANNGETVPGSPDSVEEKTKTQPSPAYRTDQLKTEQAANAREVTTMPASGRRPARIKWLIAGLTDTGLKRELNEDNLLLAEAEMPDSSPYGLYLVADGMGGHHGGDIASQLIVDTIQQRFERSPLSYETPFNDWLTSAVLAANERVLAHQPNRAQEKRMGSTLVLALVTEGQAHIANVGDSRAYHITEEGIEQISIDHSLVERLVQLGQLTREEARTHRQRNVIYNTIGDKPNPEIGLYHLLLQPGDRLLLCSDGLSSMLSDADILAISRRQPDTAAACKALVEEAIRAGGDDNITVILIQAF